MDGDPAVEPTLDSLSLTFPLPYRVALLVVLAVWGWAVNLHYLGLVAIDVPALLRYPPRDSPRQPAPHLSTYRLAALVSAALGLSLVVFWACSGRDPDLVVAYDWMPMTYLLLLALALALPIRGAGALSTAAAGRARLVATLRRVALGGLAEPHTGRFADILLADVLTSYSKVLGDLFVVVCMFLTRGGSATDRPDRACGGAVVVPLVMAWPFAARLRQCLIEYLRARRAPPGAAGWGGAHLANAAKYASAFPVILLSALQRGVEAEADGGGDGSTDKTGAGLYRAWLVAVLVNSLFSFYWDVAKDWDLTLLSGARGAPGQAYGLRRKLLLPPGPALYYLVVALDLLLRCTWSLKLSPHLGRLAGAESSVFFVELLEVFRRWVWIFFRVETEHLRAATAGGPDEADDMILLGDFQAKYHDEESS